MRLVATSAILATGLLGSAHADGDALVDMLGPREVAVGEAMRGGATGATAIGLNPAGLPLNHELVFEGGYGYRGSDQASLIGVSACDSTNAMPGCFYYDYADSSPEMAGLAMHRKTHIAGSSLGYPISPRVFVGISAKYFHYDSDVMGESSSSGFNWDLGTTFKLTDLVNIGAAGYNLLGADSVQFPRAAGGGVFARPIPSLAISFDARWKLINGDHSARYGGGAELFIRAGNGQMGYPIRAGVLRDNGLGTTYASGGLGYATMKFSVDLAARRAVTGSNETLLIASMRFYGPRIEGGGQTSPDE